MRNEARPAASNLFESGIRKPRLPLTVLIGFQGFRLPLELILHRWATIGTVPETMTWTGQNFDVISAAVALVTAPLVSKWPCLAWIPSIIGLGLLLNVMRVVVLSSPLPFSWQLHNQLQLIMYLPYALIVPLCVAPALIGHLVVVSYLLRRENKISLQIDAT